MTNHLPKGSEDMDDCEKRDAPISEAMQERAAIALMEQQGNKPDEGSSEWEGALGNAEADVRAVLDALGISYV